MEFKELKLSSELQQTIQEMGYSKLTPIQERAIPLVLQGKDVLAQSKTGSGKTAAFALPLLDRLIDEYKELQVLIVCPTRELAAQVVREIRKMGKRNPILQVVLICGGMPMRPQIEALQRRAQIVVGTPGRVADLLDRNLLPTRSIETFVLDEADQMLDMGFEDEMNFILSKMPEPRQTLLFSATYPEGIIALSRKFQKNPLRVTIEDSEDSTGSIEQSYFPTENDEKLSMLMRILRRSDPNAALVFRNLKINAAEIEANLKREHFSVAQLTGDLEQLDREAVMAKFRNGSIRVLVATDVAARGLDIEDLPMVINYELPNDPEIYVHRIGRTGRAGKSGVAHSLVSAAEMLALSEIQKVTKKSIGLAVLAPKNSQPRPRPADMQTLLIGGGRKDKVRPGDLLGALTGEAGGFSKSEIGKIEIHDRWSYVGVSKSIAASALRGLMSGRIKGQRFQVQLLE